MAAVSVKRPIVQDICDANIKKDTNKHSIGLASGINSFKLNSFAVYFFKILGTIHY